ncbi:cation:proton antiporter regulatory subunit [Paenibacillus contaminans]|uniref:Potassium:proton antiporter n=1 Tax=Paenibacillus contaminans TaxID=450362 RepID=A0A329MHH1_9BACL|nr:cation:proton antiporter regulatory subunit [Paenibacillus contaminans]RAV19339.1 potassium:proton antiporter [Paenibacillus contaminans]
MNIRETDLPGIGKKFQMITRFGDKLVLIVHDDGRRECYHFDQDDQDEMTSMITLDDDEARYVAGIIGGMAYKPKALETIEVVLDDLVIEWYRIEEGCCFIGKTIGELDIRGRTGATIIAISEKHHNQINPDPNIALTADTTLIVAGDRRQQKAFKNLLMNGGG